MSKKQYVCDNEYEGAFVGTLQEIDEWLCETGYTPRNCTFYELGEKVNICLAVASKENK